MYVGLYCCVYSWVFRAFGHAFKSLVAINHQNIWTLLHKCVLLICVHASHYNYAGSSICKRPEVLFCWLLYGCPFLPLSSSDALAFLVTDFDLHLAYHINVHAYTLTICIHNQIKHHLQDNIHYTLQQSTVHVYITLFPSQSILFQVCSHPFDHSPAFLHLNSFLVCTKYHSLRRDENANTCIACLGTSKQRDLRITFSEYV